MSSSGKLTQILESLERKKFTGRLDIKNRTGQQWRIYLCLGRFIWADGGYHPYREWERLLRKHFPELDTQLLDVQNAKQYECWNYYLIASLLQRFLITKTQAYNLIDEKIKQSLLDIYQAEISEKLYYEIVRVSENFSSESGLKTSIHLVKIETVLAETQAQWNMWRKYDVTHWNPHFAPVIKNPVLLRQRFQGKENTYQKLVSLFNGKHPLTELADRLNLTILKLIVWFKPYLESGIINLIPIKDFDIDTTLIGINNYNYKITQSTQQRLIVCIDDSVQICEIVEHIVKEAGYQFMAIQDPLKALPELIKSKPDLILLDLIMPIVNGYEICTQIRRVSSLRQVPVIILTGNDGVIDRFKSKMVGANGFLGKPIDQDKLLTKIKSLLANPKRDSYSLDTQISLQTRINPN